MSARFVEAVADHCEAVGPPKEAGEAAWLALRRTGIGSSDCSAVVGMNPYESPFSVWQQKTGQAPSKDLSDNEFIYWGNRLEPIIREEAAKELGLEVLSSLPTVRSKAHPHMLANLDGWFPEVNAIFEAKNTSAYASAKWENGDAPDHALLQVHHSMIVTGARLAYVAGLVGGNHLQVVEVAYDPELAATLIAAEQQFWDRYIIGNEEPPIDPSDATRDALVSMNLTGSGDVVDATNPDDVHHWVTAYKSAQLAEKRAGIEKSLARNNLLALLGSAAALTDPATGNVLVAVRRGQLNQKAFTAEYPEIAAGYLEKVEKLNTAALKAEHPELFRKHQAIAVLPK